VAEIRIFRNPLRYIDVTVFYNPLTPNGGSQAPYYKGEYFNEEWSTSALRRGNNFQAWTDRLDPYYPISCLIEDDAVYNFQKMKC